MRSKQLGSRKTVHLKNFNYSSPEEVYFLTLCTAQKHRYFFEPEICQEIVNQLEYRHAAKEMKLYCCCVMPDHLHLLISLNESYARRSGAFGERTLQDWVSSFKRYTSRVIGHLHAVRPLWQQDFYDHVVRSDESLVQICEYIVNNPVRKGMVSKSGEYPYSRLVDPLPT